VIVRTKAFFTAEQCEEVITEHEAKQRGLHIKVEAEAVRSFHGRYGDCPGYRISDCVTEQQRSGIAVRTTLSTTDLKARKWTETLIRQFLPEPDKTVENPHYLSGPPIRLYNLDRVEAIEKQVDFQDAIARAARRSEAASKAATTREERTMGMVADLAIEVPPFQREELIRLACDSYNSWTCDREGDLLAAPDADPDFLARICVNFLRHEMTPYDNGLEQLHGRTGRSDAHYRLKRRILDAIAEEYPWLDKECERQLKKFREEQAYQMQFR
jgi:hypothetical protein